MTTNTYPETNAEVIEKALYCLKHGETESVENWLELLRERLSNKKSLAPELASEAANQRPEMEGNLMEVDPTAAAIVDASAADINETSSKVSRADALTDDKRQALGEALTEYFVALDSDTGTETPDRILCLFDYHDSRNIDNLIDRAIVPALDASPVEQPAQMTAQAALAAIETFEIVGENNDSREPNADDRFVLTEFIAHLFGSITVEQPAVVPIEEMIRFCPECGRLGDIPAGYEACCPDWSHARIVPKRFAELCAETFRLCVSQPYPLSITAPTDARAAFEAWYDRTYQISAEALRTGSCDESVEESRGELALGFNAGWKARAASASETGAEGLDGLAHELWAAAQIQPRQLEGIEDGVRRIKAILSRSPAMASEAMATIGEHDLSTSAGGRSYVAEFFAKRLRRHDFDRYINESLAADFACALARHLSDRGITCAEESRKRRSVTIERRIEPAGGA